VTDDDLERWQESQLSLLETLDHVLNRGVVVAGEITISVADVELIFVGLNLLVGSVETIQEVLGRRGWHGDALPRPVEPGSPEPGPR
jgi:hypothetical protein